VLSAVRSCCGSGSVIDIDAGHRRTSRRRPGRPVRFQAAHDRHGRLLAKVALWLRGSGTTTFRVNRPVLIKGWPQHAPTRRLVLRQANDCGWRAFPGGFLFPKPRRCIRLLVAADDRSSSVRLGLGRAC
jgi:hypothetical protein